MPFPRRLDSFVGFHFRVINGVVRNLYCDHLWQESLKRSRHCSTTRNDNKKRHCFIRVEIHCQAKELARPN